MPHFSPTPINAVDANARQAFSQLCRDVPDLARRLQVNSRTIQRIAAGQAQYVARWDNGRRVARECPATVTGAPDSNRT